MSLYLKYRPQNFKTLVGQDHAKKTIQNALSQGSLSHAYLFAGPRGTGKTSLARILAKGLNCQSPGQNSEPCNQCNICDSINKAKLVDLIEIDAASNRGIDEIRELRDKIVFAPSQAKSKVYIIDEVHMLTKEAFNALLKTLEEPPSHAYFILATTEAHKIPETIVSRCQQFTFSHIASADISKRLEEIILEEGGSAEPEALDLIARLSAGGLRDAIGLLEQMMASGAVTLEGVTKNLGLTGVDHLEKFFRLLVERKALKAIELLSQIKSRGYSVSQFLREIISYFREQMLINLGSSHETKTIIGFIDIFTLAKAQVDLSPVPELPIEIAIIRACEFENPEGESTPEKNGESAPEKRIITKASALPDETAGKESAEIPELDIKRVKADWPRVLEAVETPFIRMSLKDGEPISYQSGILTLAFKSAAFMEKISRAGNQEEVQRALEKVYGSRLSLNLDTKKVSLNIEKKEVQKDKPSAVEMAAEVFGIK